MNGASIALGVIGGMVLAGAVQARLGSANVTLPSAATLDAIGARLTAFQNKVMRQAGDDPSETSFDPEVYSFSYAELSKALKVQVIGNGNSRLVVRVAPGVVAKFPWRDELVAQNVAEYEAYQEASPEVQALLLPPLGLVHGVILFPEVERLDPKDQEDPAFAEAINRWSALYLANAPGANATDIASWRNWGRHNGRLVLLDYEPEWSFNRVGPSAERKVGGQAVRGAARAGRAPFATWAAQAAQAAGFTSAVAFSQAHPELNLYDRWIEGASPRAILPRGRR